VKFDVAEDRERATVGAPWLIFDHYLSVKPWTPDFVAAHAKIDTTMVWIRISGLGMQFFDESIILTLASGIGRPIRVDMNTVDMYRGRFARVCVEIDLDKPVVGKLCLRDAWYNVEYEGLHLLCSSCGCYGHIARNCLVSITTPVTGTAAPEHGGSPLPFHVAATVSQTTAQSSAAINVNEGIASEIVKNDTVINGNNS
jgi:hypothetical protein